MSGIDTVAVGLPRRGDAVLVSQLSTPAGESFYRPIGGTVELGESSGETVEREFDEEVALPVTAGPVIGVIENQFRWDGEHSQEVMLCRAATIDASVAERDTFEGQDAGGAVQYTATWKTPAALRAASEPVYPEGVLDVLVTAGVTHVVSDLG